MPQRRSTAWWALPFLALVLIQVGTFRRSLRISFQNVGDSSNDENAPMTKPPIIQKPTISPHQDRLESMERLKHALQINSTVELLRKLHISKEEIPLWSDIDNLYGPDFPHIIGMERCQEYRDANSRLRDRWVAPAGLFHTGTNLVATILPNVCQGLVKRWQVPYGKHHPIQSVLKDNYIIDKPMYQQMAGNFSSILPIVMVRHPLDWMRSECQQMFGVKLNKNETELQKARRLPCPHLTTKLDADFYRSHHYESMLHLWMEWNQEYLDYEGPRLIVRLEDMVYRTEETLQQICACAGGTFNYSQHKIMDKREGGTKRDDQDGSNYRFKAWKRHAQVSIDGSFGRSWGNKKQFRQVASTQKMKSLLDIFHYTILENQETNKTTTIE